MLRFLTLSLLLMTPDLFAGTVERSNSARKRMLISLDAHEIGMFKPGDELKVKVHRSPQKFRGYVLKIRDNQTMAVSTVGTKNLPKSDAKVNLTPTYKNRIFTDAGTRLRNGNDSHGDSNIVAIEGGNILLPEMISYGWRGQHYFTKHSALMLSYSRGYSENSLTKANAEMASLQHRLYFNRNWHLGTGLGFKRSTATLNPRAFEKAANGAFGDATNKEIEDVDFSNNEYLKLVNVVDDYFVEMGIGGMLSFETNSLGVLVMGWDLATVQWNFHQEYNEDLFHEGLEEEISIKNDHHVYSRIFMGFTL